MRVQNKEPGLKGEVGLSVGLGCEEVSFWGSPGGWGSVQAQDRGLWPVDAALAVSADKVSLDLRVLTAQGCPHTRQS